MRLHGENVRMSRLVGSLGEEQPIEREAPSAARSGAPTWLALALGLVAALSIVINLVLVSMLGG